MDKLVPEHIRALGPYAPGKPIKQAEAETGILMTKMASNENPFGPSPKAIHAMRDAALSANYYPDNDVSELRIRIAEANNVDPEKVMVTDGSTAFLDIIARTLLGPGLNAVTSERTFIVYPIVTRAAGGTLIQVPMKNDAFDLDGIANAINKDTRVVFLANPNNPTGTMFDAAAMDRFLERVPDHVLVVLDEAYYDFAQGFAAERGIDYSHWHKYIDSGRNVLVLRTFSKAHGLAGVRVGYGFGPPELIQYFSRVRTAFSISAVAEAAALAAMNDDEHIRKSVRSNMEQAKLLTERLTEMGVRVVPTSANFIYVDLGSDSAADVAHRMQLEGVIIRPLGPWGIPNAIRITIGTPEQNRLFLSAFKKVTERAAVR